MNFNFYSWKNSRQLRLLFGFYIYIYICKNIYLYISTKDIYSEELFYLLENGGRYTNISISICICDTLRTFLRVFICLDFYHSPLLIFIY